MAAEAELNVHLSPRLSGVDDLIGQLRRTGAALEGLADSLQALSDGGPDTMRSTPADAAYVRTDYAKCPAAQRGTEHDGHDFAVTVGHPDDPGQDTLRTVWRCAGHPERPWGPGQ